jgi:hypothetical protein
VALKNIFRTQSFRVSIYTSKTIFPTLNGRKQMTEKEPFEKRLIKNTLQCYYIAGIGAIISIILMSIPHYVSAISGI